jgi:hypothetical protein
MKIINRQQASSVSGGTLADHNDYKAYTILGGALGTYTGAIAGWAAGGAYCYQGGLMGVLLGGTIGYALGAALYGFQSYTIAASDNMFKPAPISEINPF